MEVNTFIFPAPKCQYTEQNFKELIWIPLYKETIISKPKSQVYMSPQIKRPQTQQNYRLQDSYQDDDVDENIEVHKSPPRLLQQYTTNNLETLQNKKVNNKLYESLASICTQTKNTIQHPRTIKLSKTHLKSVGEEEFLIKKIPCIYINNLSKQTLIYFHANGEDLYYAYELMWHLGNQLGVNIIGVEYPGYGIYKGESNEQVILEDADTVMKYLINQKRIQESNILICGRSIGSGPACYLASKYQPQILILISPFLSIKQLVEYKFGKLFSALIKERFANHKNISEVKCPIFILHGNQDNVVPLRHSLKLQRLCKSRCKLMTPYHMTHGTFNLKSDLIQPLLRFMKE